MITREFAIETLYSVINSGIISEDLEEKLQNIANCIEDEMNLSIHAWGMPDDDYCELHTCYKTDLPEYEQRMQNKEEICKRYSFNDKTASN